MNGRYLITCLNIIEYYLPEDVILTLYLYNLIRQIF